MTDGRLTDRIRGRVTNADGSTYRSANGTSQPWEDVLLVRRIDEGVGTVDVWGRAVHHPDLVAEHAHDAQPQYVYVAAIVGGDIQPMPRKGAQRLLVLGDGTELTVHVMKNCCSSPFRDFLP